MSAEAVELEVAGQRCRVVTTATPDELAELGAMVEDKLAAICADGRPATTQAMLLAAIALANEAKEAKAEAARAQARADRVIEGAKARFTALLGRVERVLGQSPDTEADPPAPRRRRGRTKEASAREGDETASRSHDQRATKEQQHRGGDGPT